MRNLSDLIRESNVDFAETQEKCDKIGEDLAKQFIRKCRELEKLDNKFVTRETMVSMLMYLFDTMLEDETIELGDAITQICKDYNVL